MDSHQKMTLEELIQAGLVISTQKQDKNDGKNKENYHKTANPRKFQAKLTKNRRFSPEFEAFPTKIDPNSDKIAYIRSKTPVETDRIQRISVEREKQLQIESNNLTFTPSFQSNTEKRGNNGKDYLYYSGIEEIRRKKEAVERCLTENCSFRPVINRDFRGKVRKTTESKREKPKNQLKIVHFLIKSHSKTRENCPNGAFNEKISEI